jgi:hypothetical protein
MLSTFALNFWQHFPNADSDSDMIRSNQLKVIIRQTAESQQTDSSLCPVRVSIRRSADVRKLF